MATSIETEIENLHQLIRHTVSQAMQRANDKNDGQGLEARIKNLEMAARILATPTGTAACTKQEEKQS